jgi:hypothetical protein
MEFPPKESHTAVSHISFFRQFRLSALTLTVLPLLN